LRSAYFIKVVPVGAIKQIKKIKQINWMPDKCPACGAKELSCNYFTGEVFCLKCGLVLF